MLLVLLWCATHHYQGLGGDAELYAVQAWARIHPNLFHDLYLQNTSQDSYSVFSSFYAACIGLIGLRNAALGLMIVFKAGFFAAAWLLARRLASGPCAFLAVAVLIVTAGGYGAFGVFHTAEDWLTARTPAEALVLAALACGFYGSRLFAGLLACAALFVHPLMALPGLMLLICLGLPWRLSAAGAAAGILLALGIALGAQREPLIARFFPLMDADWLEVVRERSQFLFLEYWRAADWSLNVRPFLSLCLAALAIDDARVRKFSAAAMLVGAAGLAVALVAGLGPVSLLLQGQAWRWVWVTGFASVLLLPATVLSLWRSATVGKLCSLLMISAWTFSTIGGAAWLACAVVLWLMRDRINAPAERILRGVAVRSGVITETIGGWIRRIRSALSSPLVAVMLVAACMICVPRALRDLVTDGTAAQIDELSDWRGAIPPNANVFVVPAHNSAAFAWFTLERPSYLTVDQSSGVVFARATALEVRRRSQVLLPLMDPDWRLLSKMQAARSGSKTSASLRPLTREELISVCADPQLNFVVAREELGFQPLRHIHPGIWQDWNLYDCRRVTSPTPAA